MFAFCFSASPSELTGHQLVDVVEGAGIELHLGGIGVATGIGGHHPGATLAADLAPWGWSRELRRYRCK